MPYSRDEMRCNIKKAKKARKRIEMAEWLRDNRNFSDEEKIKILSDKYAT